MNNNLLSLSQLNRREEFIACFDDLKIKIIKKNNVSIVAVGESQRFNVSTLVKVQDRKPSIEM